MIQHAKFKRLVQILHFSFNFIDLLQEEIKYLSWNNVESHAFNINIVNQRCIDFRATKQKKKQQISVDSNLKKHHNDRIAKKMNQANTGTANDWRIFHTNPYPLVFWINKILISYFCK